MDVGSTTHIHYKCHMLETKLLSHRLFCQKNLECGWGKSIGAYKRKIIIIHKAIYVKSQRQCIPLDRIQDRFI